MPFAIVVAMPPGGDRTKEKTLQDVVDDVGLYPIDAFLFVQEGFGFTMKQYLGKQHLGEQPEGDPPASDEPHHITGQELSLGLRDYAINQWGLLAIVVLQRWNITATLDFGRIVFALVDGGLMQKTEHDTIEDFRNVYDFKTTFDPPDPIRCKS